MTPRTKGSKSEPKKIWDFYIDIDRKKLTVEKLIDSLQQHSFRNFKLDEEMHDVKASISLELDFNASKFAKDILQRYKGIKEIEVKSR